MAVGAHQWVSSGASHKLILIRPETPPGHTAGTPISTASHVLAEVCSRIAPSPVTSFQSTQNPSRNSSPKTLKHRPATDRKKKKGVFHPIFAFLTSPLVHGSPIKARSRS